MKPLLPEVRAAIVKAVPSIVDKADPDNGRYQEYTRPIRLADVLRAMQVACGKHDSAELWCNRETAEIIFERGTYDGEGDDRTFAKWNLTLDNLDDQSEEAIDFIHKILCV